MKRDKPDRRIERTRQALRSAFVNLTLTRGYTEVTVEDIAAQANVGRSTFYMHYRGKDDLLRQSLTWPSAPLAAIVAGDVAPDKLVPLLEHFREQRKLNRVFFETPIRTIWVRHLAGLIEQHLPGTARSERASRLQLPRSLMALQLAETQIGLIAHWLTGRFNVRPDIVAETLVATTRAQVVALLKRED
jgi:AcrR family transcriptional regulator